MSGIDDKKPLLGRTNFLTDDGSHLPQSGSSEVHSKNNTSPEKDLSEKKRFDYFEILKPQIGFENLPTPARTGNPFSFKLFGQTAIPALKPSSNTEALTVEAKAYIYAEALCESLATTCPSHLVDQMKLNIQEPNFLADIVEQIKNKIPEHEIFQHLQTLVVGSVYDDLPVELLSLIARNSVNVSCYEAVILFCEYSRLDSAVKLSFGDIQKLLTRVKTSWQAAYGKEETQSQVADLMRSTLWQLFTGDVSDVRMLCQQLDVVIDSQKLVASQKRLATLEEEASWLRYSISSDQSQIVALMQRISELVNAHVGPFMEQMGDGIDHTLANADDLKVQISELQITIILTFSLS